MKAVKGLLVIGIFAFIWTDIIALKFHPFSRPHYTVQNNTPYSLNGYWVESTKGTCSGEHWPLDVGPGDRSDTVKPHQGCHAYTLIIKYPSNNINNPTRKTSFNFDDAAEDGNYTISLSGGNATISGPTSVSSTTHVDF